VTPLFLTSRARPGPLVLCLCSSYCTVWSQRLSEYSLYKLFVCLCCVYRAQWWRTRAWCAVVHAAPAFRCHENWKQLDDKPRPPTHTAGPSPHITSAHLSVCLSVCLSQSVQSLLDHLSLPTTRTILSSTVTTGSH